MNNKQKALLELKDSLFALKHEYTRCVDAMNNCAIDCNDYVCDEYPFDLSFDELDIVNWCERTIRNINQEFTFEQQEHAKAKELAEAFNEWFSNPCPSGGTMTISFDDQEHKIDILSIDVCDILESAFNDIAKFWQNERS